MNRPPWSNVLVAALAVQRCSTLFNAVQRCSTPHYDERCFLAIHECDYRSQQTGGRHPAARKTRVASRCGICAGWTRKVMVSRHAVGMQDYGASVAHRTGIAGVDHVDVIAGRQEAVDQMVVEAADW
jgi:hypothetical protein